jgi:hypothetical protein
MIVFQELCGQEREISKSKHYHPEEFEEQKDKKLVSIRDTRVFLVFNYIVEIKEILKNEFGQLLDLISN